MNRKSFLKKLGIGLGVAVVAPAVLTADHIAEKVDFRVNDFPIPNKMPPIKESKVRGNVWGYDLASPFDNARWNYMNEKCAKALIEEYKNIGLFDLP